MEGEQEYTEKVNLTHPPIGADIKEQDKRAYVMEQTKRAIEEAVKEFREDKQILEEALLDGRLVSEPQTYSEVLSKRFGSEFTKRFYGFSTLSKDVLMQKQKADMPVLSDIDPEIQHGVLANAMTAFTNMHIAHEICINNNYKIRASEKKLETMEDHVTDRMRKTFWDIVDEDLERDPPIYDHVLIVFQEIKEKMLALLLPHNGAIRLRIEDTLDIDSIKKEIIENEEFYFEKYVKFSVDVLSKLCSQSREDQVESIRRLRKPSEIFSRMFEVLEMLKLDLSNFLIMKYRPKIMEHCITYERQMFVEFLELEYDLTRDGLHGTRLWLLRHKIKGRDTPSVIAKAFGEIITWNYKNPWPETLSLDGMRLANTARVIKRATLFGAMSLSVIELCKPLFIRNYYVIYNTLRRELDNRFKALLPVSHMKDNNQIAEDAAMCAEEAVKVVNKQLQSFESKSLPEDVANSMRQAVKDVIKPNNKTRSHLMMRIMQYIEESVFAESKYKVPLTSGLSSIKVEIELSTTEYCRIVLHNRNAYNDIYCDIVDGKYPEVAFNNNIKDQAYLQYLYKLKKTHRSSTSMAKEVLPGVTLTTQMKEASPDATKTKLKDDTHLSSVMSTKRKVPSVLPTRIIASGQIDHDILKIFAPPPNDSVQQSENPSVIPSRTAVQNASLSRVAPASSAAVEEKKSHSSAVPTSLVGTKSIKSASSVVPVTPSSQKIVKLDNLSKSKDPVEKIGSSAKLDVKNEIQPSIKTTAKISKEKTAVSSEPRKSITLQLPEDNLNLHITGPRFNSASSLYNCAGSVPNSWTPSATDYFSAIGSVTASSLSDISMDVHSNSQIADDLDSAEGTVESPAPSVAATESEHYIHFLKQAGKHPEPMKRTSPGDVSIKPSYDNDDREDSDPESYLDVSGLPFLHEDRFLPQPVHYYPSQFLGNRTNPYLLSATVPDYLRFAHPLLNKMVMEYEELKTYCKDTIRVCTPKAKVKDSISWLDVDDVEGVNWKNHWILRKEAIYKHWRESRPDRKSSDQELVIDDEVLAAYAKAKAIAEAEAAKLKSAKDKVFDFLENYEREGMIQQKQDMDKAVEKIGKSCPGKEIKTN